MPTLKPWRANVAAKLTDTVDFPTPPLPKLRHNMFYVGNFNFIKIVHLLFYDILK